MSSSNIDGPLVGKIASLQDYEQYAGLHWEYHSSFSWQV